MTEIKFRNDIQVTLIQSMGDDEMVARAARVSTGKDQMRQDKITGLINYLVREGHTSTLEHCVMTLRFEVPIFVAREFMRHRTMSYNEISGRYSELEPEFYVPGEDRPLSNEGSGAHPNLVQGMHHDRLLGSSTAMHKRAYGAAWEAYQDQLTIGVANEVARNVLPVGIYTKFYATANLNNWLKFVNLRAGHTGAPQYEIAEAAQKVEQVIKTLYPITYEAWRKTL